MTEVAIIPGHHPDAPGAAMQVGGGVVHEYELWAPFAQVLAGYVDACAEVVRRPNKDPDEALAKRIHRTGADLAIELHFNAAGTPEAGGTEMLYDKGDEPSRKLARTLQEEALGALGLADRGVKTRVGWPFLALTDIPSVICEPAFGSNEDDAFALATGLSELVVAYSTAIETHV